MSHRNFHISRGPPAKYQVDDSLFSLRGTVVFANFYSARLLAQKINQARDIARNPARRCRQASSTRLGSFTKFSITSSSSIANSAARAMAQAVSTLV